MSRSLAVISCLLFSGCAAQPFVDIYAGATVPDVEVEGVSADLDPAFALGGRGGAYFETGMAIEPGVGLDVSNSFLDLDLGRDDKLNSTAISPLLFVRGFPSFDVHPYVAVGPAIIVTTGDAVDTSVDLGLDVRAGIIGLGRTMESYTLSIFLEYRYVRVDQDLEFGFVKLDTEQDFHSVLVGVSTRF